MCCMKMIRNRNYFLRLAIIIGLGTGLSANAQEALRFHHLSVNNGLSNSNVSCIYQDSTGYIWIGTEDGINRFNGQEINQYNSKYEGVESPRTNQISAMCQSKGDDFWISHKKGIDHYTSDLDQFQPIPLKESDGESIKLPTLTLHKDNEGNVLAGTSRGIFSLDKTEGCFRRMIIPSANFINNEEITYITSDRHGNYWIGTLNKGVYSYNIGSQVLTELSQVENGINTLVNNKIFHLYEDSNNSLWIGSEQGLYKYGLNDKSLVRFPTEPGKSNSLPHRTVSQIFEDNQNRLWVLTNAGLCKYNRSSNTFHVFRNNDSDPFSLSNNAIRCIMQDIHNNIWIGTYENGVNILKSKSIEFENVSKASNQNKGLNYAYVKSITGDMKDQIWIGTNGGGLNIYNYKENRFSYILPDEKTNGGIKSDAVNCLLFDERGILWIGTYLGGLTRYDPYRNIYKTFLHNPMDSTSISNNIINRLYLDSKKNLWISTNNGICRFIPEDESFITIRNTDEESAYSLTSVFCTVLLEDAEGMIWIGTYYGLNRLDPNTGIINKYLSSEKPGSLSDNNISAIMEDSEKRIWIGTSLGLNLFQPETGSFAFYTTADGLPNNSVNGIMEDSQGKLWISTNNGLSVMNPVTGSFSNFDFNDGLITTEFENGAYYQSPDRKFYFGGKKGYISFYPDKYKAAENRYSIIIDKLFINNKLVIPGEKKSPLTRSVSKTSLIELKYNQSFFGFDFASLNYINPEKDRYAYKLENFDDQWIDIGNKTTANYTNIPPGKYSFLIRVTHNNNSTSYSKPIQIQVFPPIWKTAYAYVFYILLIFTAIYLVWNYYNAKTIYKHNLQIERIENEKIIELNQSKLKFFINVSHEFKTPLTLIMSPIEKLIKSTEYRDNPELFLRTLKIIYRNAERLSRLISQIMDLRKIDTNNIKLGVNKYEFVQFVREIAEGFNDFAIDHAITFDIKSSVQALDVWFDHDKIEKSIFNILSNAFRYTPDRGIVIISIDRVQKGVDATKVAENTEYVKVSISDNGKGISSEKINKIFNRFYQADDNILANPASSGIGLSIAKEFIEIHKGIITVESTLNQGSNFTIYLPLGKDHFSQEDFAEILPKINLTHLLSTQAYNPKRNTPKASNEPGNAKYKILVAEDNNELRNFILDNLELDYEVFEAGNGAEAMKMATSVHPNLILSDIMMPEISGYELCKQLKLNIDTSHIPIILITVISELDEQINAFDIGADDYVVKPFNMSLLEAKIRSILRNRLILTQKYMVEPRMEIHKLATNSLDEEFLKKAVDSVAKNMDNFDYSVEDICRELALSRSRLHIKLKALTNQSATEFIRATRLRRAATLLENPRYNISEVSYMVGFNNISYFNRCFRKHFNKTPSEYQKDPFST